MGDCKDGLINGQRNNRCDGSSDKVESYIKTHIRFSFKRSYSVFQSWSFCSI